MLKTLLAAAALVALAAPAAAQNITAPDATVPSGITVEAVMVHGASLEGNLEGNAATREVMVVLPPSYASHPDRHYPVVYSCTVSPSVAETSTITCRCPLPWPRTRLKGASSSWWCPIR